MTTIDLRRTHSLVAIPNIGSLGASGNLAQPAKVALVSAAAAVPPITMLHLNATAAVDPASWDTQCGRPVTQRRQSGHHQVHEEAWPMKFSQIIEFETRQIDEFNAHPTAEGKRWGLDVAMRGDTPVVPGGVIRALTLDELGFASAWVREYRADRPGSGYVQLWGLGMSVERLPYVRAVAEYGLLRKS